MAAGQIRTTPTTASIRRWEIGLSRPARVLYAAAGGVGTPSGLVFLVEVDEQRRGVLLQLAHRSIRPVKGWGRSDDDHRHRLVISGALQTPSEAPTSPIQYLTHGFQLSAMLQAYSRLPLNITSGVTTIQGTAGRPIVDGAFIPRNAGNANVPQAERPSQSHASPRRPRQLEVLAEAFNVTNHVNMLTRNGNFGAGAYPSSPRNVRPDYRCGRTQVVSVWRARPILRRVARSWPGSTDTSSSSMNRWTDARER